MTVDSCYPNVKFLVLICVGVTFQKYKWTDEDTKTYISYLNTVLCKDTLMAMQRILKGIANKKAALYCFRGLLSCTDPCQVWDNLL